MVYARSWRRVLQMKYKIGLGLIVAAIGFTMCALAMGPGHTHRAQELAGPAFHFPALQPVY
jgi:hypothetical protein